MMVFKETYRVYVCVYADFISVSKLFLKDSSNFA